MPRKYSVAENESNSSELSEIMSIDSWAPLDDLSLSLHLSRNKSAGVVKPIRKNLFTIFSRSNDFATFTALLKKDNMVHYLHYIHNSYIRDILQQNPEKIAPNTIVNVSQKASFASYYFIFLYLSIVLDFENDYHTLLCYHSSYNIQTKHTETSKALLNDRTFYVNLLRAVFSTHEDQVFQLILEKIQNIQILYKRKIIQTFLEYDRIKELKQLFSGKRGGDFVRSKGRSSLFVNNDALLQNFGKIFNLLLDYRRLDLVQGIFLKFELQKREIFMQMVKFSEDKHLLAFSKIFDITLTDNDFNLLIDHQRYFFLLTLGKSVLGEIFSNERRFKKESLLGNSRFLQCGVRRPDHLAIVQESERAH